MAEHTTVFITDTTPGVGTRTYTESGKKTSMDVDSLTPNTEYIATAEYEDPDGTVIQSSNSMTFRTLPAGTFTISNPNWQNDNDGQHSTFTFDYTSTYALSYAQVVDMATGVTYQGTIVGTSVTTQLPTGTAGTQHNFQLIIADIYGYSYVQGYVMTLQASMAETPFYIEAENPSDAPQISLTKTGSPTSLTMQISYDNSTWTNYTIGNSIVLNESHPRVYFKNSSDTRFSTGSSNYYKFTADNYINVGGNISSLKSNTLTDSMSRGYDFSRLFHSNTYLRNANNLYLGNYTTIADYCYQYMFYGCTSLTTAPALPATTLGTRCYIYMFQGCTSLTQAPALPATTLTQSCYAGMFKETSLTTAPALPATTLATDCYYGMFYKCTSLTRTPELPATTLASGCYYEMFSHCTALTQAPELPATTLAVECYRAMFNYCDALTQAPALPATTLADDCYDSMFSHCTALTQAPKLPATNLVYSCYKYMFSSCTSLASITCLAEDISATSCTTDWVINVAATGTFIKSPNMSSWRTGTSGIPTNWTVVDYRN